MGYYIKTENCRGLSIFYFMQVITELHWFDQFVQNHMIGRITTSRIELSFS